MTHFVLFHGAWHQGSAWDRVVPLLTEHGHTAVTPSLRADAGTRMADHVAQVETALRRGPGDERITVVAHSYAGLPVSQAVLNRTDAVARVVLVDAWLAPAGGSLLDVAPGWFGDWCRSAAVGEPAMLPVPPLWTIGVPSDSPEAAWLNPRLVDHPLATFVDPVASALDADLLDELGVERHAVLCLPSALPFREFATVAACKLHEIESGHDVMVTRRDAVASLLHNLAVN